MYTLNPAYSTFDENFRGTIEIGKIADFTIISEDITIINPEKIREVNVKMVIIDGKIVYSKD